MGEAYVLYVDHQGHPAPLSECYHATASRRLSSAVHRYPPATVTEVDSAYCPQCLSFHDAASAARLGFCPKASCKRCPICQAVCSVAAEDNLCFYKCGSCTWTSKECNLSQTVHTEDDGTIGKVELARALEDLGIQLNKRIQTSHDSIDQHFKQMTDAWEKRVKADKQREGKPARSSLITDGPEGWSVEALEMSLNEKKKKMADESLNLVVGLDVEHMSLDDDSNAVDAALSDVSVLACQLQALNYSTETKTRQDLLPLPIQLRVRQSRRCRAELAEGRPGILLKPKLNPLEGDSSLRTGHGQWWKKDSSAVHVIPHVRVVQNLVKDKSRIFLLRVTNPTLGPIRLRFCASSYKGEVDFEDNAKVESLLPSLLVDTFTQRYADIQLESDILKRMAATETVELLSAEDSFIELGGKSREIPEAVANWEPSQATDKPAMQLVAQSTSTAWFELTVPSIDGGSTTQKALPAVPFALQVEVGEGSWETSLVEKRATKDDEPDRVTFDLVVTWTKDY